MIDLGMTRSKPDFSQKWLGRGKTYVRDFTFREGREWVRVSTPTITTLRTRLRAVADRMPRGIRAEIEGVIAFIDQSTVVADLLSRRG
jgi:hypothetical protein